MNDPDRSVPDMFDPDSATPRTSARRIGDYLLVAPLGDDALGSVYRALHTADGRFVRLRVLQSPELSPHAVHCAIQRQVERRSADRSGEFRGGELSLTGGAPCLIWPETNGWTLDFVLSRSRAGGWAMPIEFALLIAERATAEIEQASLSAAAGEPTFHGALCPAFVSISSDAEVRIQGFGLAEAVLPVLSKPRMWRDVAPYIAPEARAAGRATEISDIYSIGVLLAELLTGQRASADTPPPRWRADDDFSQEVSLLLRFALGNSLERFSSISELHASLKELIAGCPFETSPADLALFLYELLNPESRVLPAPFDGNSTNPLPADRLPVAAADRAIAPASQHPLESRPTSPAAEKPRVIPRRSHRPVRWAATARGGLFGRSALRVAAVAAATVALALVNLPIRQSDAASDPGSRRAIASSEDRPPTLTASAPVTIADVVAVSTVSFPRFAESPPSPTRSKPASARAVAGAGRHSVEAGPAQTFRLKAGLARIEAERLDAATHAADVFDRAKHAEREAETFLGSRDYAAARDAFSQALALFSEAQSLSRAARVREISLATETR